MAVTDPDAVLAELRQLLGDSDPDSAARSRRYAELVGALDDWLTHGGRLPTYWVNAAEKARRERAAEKLQSALKDLDAARALLAGVDDQEKS